MRKLKPSALVKRGWTGGFNLAWDDQENRCDPKAPAARYWSIAGAVMRAQLPGVVGQEILRRICRATGYQATYEWEMDVKRKEVVLELLEKVEQECFEEYQRGGLRGVFGSQLNDASKPLPAAASTGTPRSGVSPGGPAPRASDLAV